MKHMKQALFLAITLSFLVPNIVNARVLLPGGSGLAPNAPLGAVCTRGGKTFSKTYNGGRVTCKRVRTSGVSACANKFLQRKLTPRGYNCRWIGSPRFKHTDKKIVGFYKRVSFNMWASYRCYQVGRVAQGWSNIGRAHLIRGTAKGEVKGSTSVGRATNNAINAAKKTCSRYKGHHYNVLKLDWKQTNTSKKVVAFYRRITVWGNWTCLAQRVANRRYCRFF